MPTTSIPLGIKMAMYGGWVMLMKFPFWMDKMIWDLESAKVVDTTHPYVLHLRVSVLISV